jgi:hypothetical protein
MDLFASEEAVRRDMRRAGLDDVSGATGSRYAWGFDVYRVGMAPWTPGDGDDWSDPSRASAFTFVYVLADVGRGPEIDLWIGGTMDRAARAAAVEAGTAELGYLRPVIVERAADSRPRDPRVARRAPDKIEHELGSTEEQAAIEEEMLDEAAGAALRYLKHEEGGRTPSAIAPGGAGTRPATGQGNPHFMAA